MGGPINAKGGPLLCVSAFIMQNIFKKVTSDDDF